MVFKYIYRTNGNILCWIHHGVQTLLEVFTNCNFYILVIISLLRTSFFLQISQEKSILTDDKRKYKAELLSFKEILCDIGSHAVGTNQLSDRYPNDGYVIEVTNDGGIFSKADASYIIYDSKCMKCDGKYPSCKQKVWSNLEYFN